MNVRAKRILLIGPLPPPIGGDTVSTEKLLTSSYWEKAGIEVDVIDTSSGGPVRLYGHRRNANDILRGIRILFQLLFRMDRVSTVLLWSNTSFACTLGIPILFLCSIFRKKIIFKLFGTYLTEALDGFSGLRRGLTLRALDLSSYILPQTSAFHEELVEKAGFDPEKLKIFSNFLRDDEIPDELCAKEFSGRCVFVGQIKSEKGVFEIMEALGSSGDISCDFYGEIVDRDRDAFLDRIEESRNCDYCGCIDPEKVTTSIGQYDVLLLPSYHPGEGYPGVILQAFAAGTAVIASDWKSIPEIVKDRKTGLLVAPQSSEEIRTALRHYADDPNLFRSVIEEARWIIQDFSEKSIVNDFLIGMIDQV